MSHVTALDTQGHVLGYSNFETALKQWGQSNGDGGGVESNTGNVGGHESETGRADDKEATWGRADGTRRGTWAKGGWQDRQQHEGGVVH